MSGAAGYDVRIKASAEREIDALPANVFRRVESAILRLETNPRPRGSKKLQGREGQYRLRVGRYRVLYVVDDRSRVVEVVAVGHRRDVYR